MRDLLPTDKRRRERILSLIREVYAEHGFDEIETPAMEDSERLHSGMGGDNEKLSYAVMRRGLEQRDLQSAAESGDPLELSDLGLRFDLTVPLSRFIATNRGSLPGVFRSLQIGPVWRAERPQKGRYRQFVQCDVDISGDESELAEIELLLAASDAFTRLGLDAVRLRVNDRRLLDGVLEACGFGEDARPGVLITIDKLDKIGTDGVLGELRERHGDDSEAAIAVLADALEAWSPVIGGGVEVTEASMREILPGQIAEHERVSEALASLASIAAGYREAGGRLPLDFDPTLVRGMGYYTGTIIEAAHPASGSSVGGGGRYDGMIGRFLGQDVPAAGFSIGFERIVDLIDDEAIAPEGENRAIALLVDKRLSAADAARIKAAWIDPGSRVRIERRPKNVRGLIERLGDEGFTHIGYVRDEHVADPRSITLEPLD